MTHITPAAEDQLEKSMETWKVKTLAIGGVLGILGLPLPGIEIGIAVSAVVLGVGQDWIRG